MINDLNRALLAKLIEQKIIDPAPVPEFKVRGLDRLGVLLHADPEPDTRAAGKDGSAEGTGDAGAAPKA